MKKNKEKQTPQAGLEGKIDTTYNPEMGGRGVMPAYANNLLQGPLFGMLRTEKPYAIQLDVRPEGYTLTILYDGSHIPEGFYNRQDSTEYGPGQSTDRPYGKGEAAEAAPYTTGKAAGKPAAYQ